MEAWEKAVVGVIVVLILSVTGCMARSHELIASSPDPMATACALAMSDKACLASARK